MLLKNAGEVKSDTFDAIFKFDADELQCKAACDCFRFDEALQTDVSACINAELA